MDRLPAKFPLFKRMLFHNYLKEKKNCSQAETLHAKLQPGADFLQMNSIQRWKTGFTMETLTEL